MLELGSKSKELHESLADSFDVKSIHKVYLIGNDIKLLYDRLKPMYPDGMVIYYDKNQLKDLNDDLDANVSKDDELLLKASHGIHLEKVLNHLTNKKIVYLLICSKRFNMF